ncbi:MAG: hypothetical protein ACTH1D_11775 [Mycobacteriaceae bacterium]
MNRSPRVHSRQVHAHKLIFARIRREGIDITEDAGLVESVRRSSSYCNGDGWDDAADTLVQLIRSGDLDALETMLISTDQSSYQVLTLSPFITHYSTPEITAETRKATRDKVQYG